MDDGFKDFLTQVYNYVLDEDYFVNTAPTTTISFSLLFPSCVWQSIDEDYFGCNYIPINFSVSGPDYRVFETAAVDVGRTEILIDQGSATLQDLKFIFCEVFGAVIGGMDFSGIRANSDAFEDPNVREGYELFLAMLRTIHAVLPAFIRQPDVVYLTGHRAFGVSWFGWHAALAYNALGTPDQQTISATWENTGGGGGDVLRSEPDTDTEMDNITLGTISSPLVPAALWSALRASDSNYGNHAPLPYQFAPTQSSNAYNSNGYVRGVVETISGTSSSKPWSDFVGGNKPVPASQFQ